MFSATLGPAQLTLHILFSNQLAAVFHVVINRHVFSHRNAITTTHQVENQLGYSLHNMWTARKPWRKNTPAFNVACHEYSGISHTCINIHNTIRISPDTAKPRPHKHTRIHFNASDFHEQPLLLISIRLLITSVPKLHHFKEIVCIHGQLYHITHHVTAQICTYVGWFIVMYITRPPSTVLPREFCCHHMNVTQAVVRSCVLHAHI